MLKASALLLFALTACAAETLTLAPGAGNRMSLEVEKTGLLRGKKHTLRYDRFQGTVQYDGANSKVEFWIESASVVCEDDWVSEKDRKKIVEEALKIVEAQKQPRLEFRSSAVRSTGAGEFEVAGQLTIRGVARPVTVVVREKGKHQFEGTAKFPMTAWGIKPPTAALGAVGTKDEMTLTFSLAAR